MAWEVFATTFTFALMMAHIAAEIPSYFHICGRRDPYFNKCITDNIVNVKHRLCKGIPELESPPLEPININNIVISDIDNAKLFLKDAQIWGLCDFIINSVHMDLNTLHLDTDITFKQIYLNGTYDFNIHILLTFVQKGLVAVSFDNIGAKVAIDYKLVTKNNKKYLYASKMKLKIVNIKIVESKFDSSEEKSLQLNEIISNILGSNKDEFVNRVKPTFEVEISKQILLLANNIVKHFTYDELFPDRE